MGIQKVTNHTTNTSNLQPLIPSKTFQFVGTPIPITVMQDLQTTTDMADNVVPAATPSTIKLIRELGTLENTHALRESAGAGTTSTPQTDGRKKAKPLHVYSSILWALAQLHATDVHKAEHDGKVRVFEAVQKLFLHAIPTLLSRLVKNQVSNHFKIVLQDLRRNFVSRFE